MNMRKRDEIMDEFVSQKKGFVSNARCLVEGVNVPAVDMISLHIKRKRGGYRPSYWQGFRNEIKKKFGYVLVSLFVERHKNENLEKALEEQIFKSYCVN